MVGVTGMFPPQNPLVVLDPLVAAVVVLDPCCNIGSCLLFLVALWPAILRLAALIL